MAIAVCGTGLPLAGKPAKGPSCVPFMLEELANNLSPGIPSRDPMDRAYRLIALGYAVAFAAMIAEEHDGRRVDGFMAIGHLGRGEQLSPQGGHTAALALSTGSHAKIYRH